MPTKRKITTSEYLSSNHVFSLERAVEALSPSGGKEGTRERLKYHLEQGRLKLVAREIYAVVPPGISVERFQPDPFLVASTIRADGVFSHHSALELLGAAHSVWQEYSLYTKQRRPPLALDGVTVRFLEDPKPLRSPKHRDFGTRGIERKGRLLHVTGPERSLVEGFKRPELTGGLEELVSCAAGFTTLDLDLMERVLRLYRVKNLWAATGWFLEQHAQTFHVPEAYLKRIERRRPGTAQYMQRGQRGGTLSSRWNLIIPEELVHRGEPNER